MSPAPSFEILPTIPPPWLSARISPEKAREIKETAVRIYRVLKCMDFARIDMFLTPDGEICFNEVNTIPGFTDTSRYPSMMKEAGIGFSDLIDRLIELAMQRKVGVC